MPEMEPIDNSKMGGEVEGTLSRDIIENIDYVLVPTSVWNFFMQKYGGGPAYERKVIVQGMQRTPKIELHPIVCPMYKVGADGNEVSMNESTLLSCDLSVSAAKLKLKTAMDIRRPAHECRYWYRYEGEEWKKIDTLGLGLHTKLSDAVDSDTLDVMGEELDDKRKWPRDVIVEAWRNTLEVGDVIDAQDSERKWYEGIVVRLTDDMVHVHFKGWSDRFNADIRRDSPKLQPLYSVVPRWREFRVNDKLEAKSRASPAGKVLWLEARVTKVDRVEETVTVKTRGKSGDDEYTVSFDSEDICPKGTHLKTQMGVSMYRSTRSNTKGSPVAPGAVGLVNLGNTCFMNSMLQCLSNMQVLSEYFISNDFREEVNLDNPLGMGGRLAEAYGALLSDMWSGDFTVCVPGELKSVIGQTAPQFAGYQQQDSQELMNFLLDGLHEDLNRVVEKPYTESVESNGRPDDVVARESWERHLQRNDSVIVDRVQGQLRSHVTCPVCGKDSITFDPYMCLSLPIPVVNTKVFPAVVVRLDTTVPMKVAVTLTNGCQFGELRLAVAELTGIPQQNLVGVQLFNGRFFRYFQDARTTSDIRGSDPLFFYEIEVQDAAPAQEEEPAEPSVAAARSRMSSYPQYVADLTGTTPIKSQKDPQLMYLEVCHRRQAKQHAGYASYYGNTVRRELFGTPYVIGVPKDASCADLHEAVWNRVCHMTQDPFDREHPPFDLKLTSNTGMDAGVAINNDASKPIPVRTRLMTVILDWRVDDDVNVIGLDEPAVAQLEIHESAAALRDDIVGTSIDLEACLDKHGEREQLEETDPWYCSNCKEHRRAYKQMDFWSLPEVLIIHLKRFQYENGVYAVRRDKIDTMITFPIEGLDLTNRMIGPSSCPSVYDLCAVSQHSGGLGGGHYTAVGKNWRDGKWYNFNDSSVCETTAERALTPAAYVLFYKRRRPEGQALPPLRSASFTTAAAEEVAPPQAPSDSTDEYEVVEMEDAPAAEAAP